MLFLGDLLWWTVTAFGLFHIYISSVVRVVAAASHSLNF